MNWDRRRRIARFTSGVKPLQISVKDYNDVVRLSGFVELAHGVRRAGEVAALGDGGSSVEGGLEAK